MPSTPLTDAIVALTTYANTITGESDATLSAAVESLIDGYGSNPLHMETGVDIVIAWGAADASGTKVIEATNTANRRSIFTLKGSVPVYWGNSSIVTDLHPIEKPQNVSKLTFTNSRACDLAVREFNIVNDEVANTVSTAWINALAATPVEITLDPSMNFLAISIRGYQDGGFTYDTNPLSIMLDFS